MPYWLMKSEPSVYSWDRLRQEGRSAWDGVRNHQAARNLKAMQVGDRAFFYHSNEGREIVGIQEIVRTAYPDPGDPTGRFVMVDVVPVMAVKTPVTLRMIKADPALADVALIRQSRLSVCPISDAHWAHICQLAGVKP